jgi:hypothetical protein
LRTWSERQAEIADLANRQLFFIGGAPRSGTTWVRHILDAHPDISCRGEGHFLQFLATPLGNAMQWRRQELEAKNAKLFKETEGYPLPAADDFEFLFGAPSCSHYRSNAPANPMQPSARKRPRTPSTSRT